MKITKNQLRRIIKEEKARLAESRMVGSIGFGSNAERAKRLVEMEDDYGLDNPTGAKRSMDEQDEPVAVDPEEFLYGEVDAMQRATDELRVRLEELGPQMRDVISRIPGRAMPKSRKAVMLNALILAGDALDDLERHFYEAYDKMGGRG